MARRRTSNSFRCGAEGCSETGHYSRSNRQDDRRQQANYGNGKYRCLRHANPGEVLSADNLHRTTVLESVDVPFPSKRIGRALGGDVTVSSERKSLGLFWKREDRKKAGSAFAYGRGWKAYASDFPVGTKVVITARIVLPQRDTTDQKARERQRRDAEEGL